MKLWNKELLFETPGEPSGGAPAASPPVEPPSNPTDPSPEAISASDEWVLGHFDALNADESSEDVDPIAVQPSDPIPAQAGIPEGESPSELTGETSRTVPALATPVVQAPTSSPPAPQVGAVATQPAALGSQPQPQAPDPTLIMSQIAEGIAAQRSAFIEKLATEQYVLTEKQIDDLGLTPEAAKLWALQLATVHVNSTQSITQMQAQQLPAYLNGMLEARVQNQKKEDAFFGQWPQLRAAPQAELAKVFQAMPMLHPNLKGEAWAKKAGEMACVSLGIPLERPQGANGSGGIHQTVRTPGPVVRQTNGLAHFPAGTSTAPAPVAPQMSEAERFFRLLQQTDAGDFEP